jgi:prephenate dehydratase
MKKKTIAYQGVPGAYSHLVATKIFQDEKYIESETFLKTMNLVETGLADYAIIPVENSSAGRVEDFYRIIPQMSLYIVEEHFEPIQHSLLSLKGNKLENIKTVASHPQALAQCKQKIEELNLIGIVQFNTAGSAKLLAKNKDISQAVIASSLAAELYDLEILDDNFSDYSENVTRFVVLSKEKNIPHKEENKSYITSILFTVKNIPASLYKTLGGFATNGVNLIKIETYSKVGTMYSSQFYIDLSGHIDDNKVKRAIEELKFFSEEVIVIGVYEESSYRQHIPHAM